MPVFCLIDMIRRGSQYIHARLEEWHSEVVGDLSSGGDNHTFRILQFNDIHYTLIRKFVEIEPVADVVIGAHCLRIEIDHNRSVFSFSYCHQGINRAPVELHRAPDPVCTRSNNNHRTIVLFRDNIALCSIVGNIEVIGLSRVLCCQCIDLFDKREDA